MVRRKLSKYWDYVARRAHVNSCLIFHHFKKTVSPIAQLLIITQLSAGSLPYISINKTHHVPQDRRKKCILFFMTNKIPNHKLLCIYTNNTSSIAARITFNVAMHCQIVDFGYVNAVKVVRMLKYIRCACRLNKHVYWFHNCQPFK